MPQGSLTLGDFSDDSRKLNVGDEWGRVGQANSFKGGVDHHQFVRQYRRIAGGRSKSPTQISTSVLLAACLVFGTSPACTLSKQADFCELLHRMIGCRYPLDERVHQRQQD